MERLDIERLVRLERIYKRVSAHRLLRAVHTQLELEKTRRDEAGLEDLVTEVRSLPEVTTRRNDE